MTIRDKRGLLDRLTDLPSPALELGCGSVRKWPQAISVDRRDHEAVDVVGDAFEVLARIPDGALHAVHTSHFLEHVDELEGLLGEIERVLRSGGVLEVIVPHFSNPYFYSDPTHRRFFGLYSFSYYCHDPILRRRVPHYREPFELILRRVDLLFKSSPPFVFRHLLRRLFGALVNLSLYSRELYEENFSGIVGCYSVRYVLERLPAGGDPSAAGSARG